MRGLIRLRSAIDRLLLIQEAIHSAIQGIHTKRELLLGGFAHNDCARNE